MKKILLGLSLIASLTLSSAALAQHRDRPQPNHWQNERSQWENPPEWRGHRGEPPYKYYRHNGQRYRFEAQRRGYYYNSRFGYYLPGFGFWVPGQQCWWDKRNAPPSMRGGRGDSWDTPPGLRGGRSESPDRYRYCR